MTAKAETRMEYVPQYLTIINQWRDANLPELDTLDSMKAWRDRIGPTARIVKRTITDEVVE